MEVSKETGRTGKKGKKGKKSEKDVKYCVIDNIILILQLNSEFKISPVSHEAGLVWTTICQHRHRHPGPIPSI